MNERKCKNCGVSLGLHLVRGRPKTRCGECNKNNDTVKNRNRQQKIYQLKKENKQCQSCGESCEKTRCLKCQRAYTEKHRDFYKTAVGKATVLWNNMNSRCRRSSGTYANINILFTKEEFLNWAIPEIDKFLELNPDKKPSCDRIDPDGNYEFNNIRIISLEENIVRSRWVTNVCGIYKNTPQHEKIQFMENLITSVCENINLNPSIFLIRG